VRTTLTLDDDVAKLLDKEVRKSGNSFKQVVNHFLRLGLTTKPPARKPFKVNPWHLGLPSFEKVEELLEYLEGPYHR
jgi:Ribbon-helix-helix protein, copG family